MQIRILGSFEVRDRDGIAADVPGTRLRTLVIALALEPGQLVPKATLVDWIWGDDPPADAANALQRLVSRLRKALPDGVLEGQAGGYRLTVNPDAVDALCFERLLARARQQEGHDRVRLLREALALWRGPALADVGLQDSAAFDAAVTRLEGLRLTAMEDRFEAEIGLGHGADMIAELTDAVSAHPLRERLVAALMRSLVAAGRDSEALLRYERTREALADALGVNPSPELSALHVRLLRGELGHREEHRKTNVRAELTSFVGRDDDVAAVRELVAEHRLVTLVGPGGSGKTRLATQTAGTMVGDLPDGIWLVELATTGADGDIAQATISALGLRDALLGSPPTADPTDGLVAAIRDREALLILDNCEHMIEPAAAFADRVLGECRRLRILATSREALGITGEALWSVESLAVPTDASPNETASSPAVRLLRDRAGAVRKDLVLDDQTVSTMARICRALDGMPLAIELAAARLRTMSPDQLADRLDDRFRLLTGGSRTALPRHRTLRAVVDWSWELLTAAERTVLRRLSVFSGGASLEAAERVCAGDTVGQQDVLELLTSLTEKSLLVADRNGEPRYRMLGTIHEYAAGRLHESGESDLARRTHLAYFTELAETAEPNLRRAEQVEWLAALDAEHDNIGAAMRGAIQAGDAQAAMRLGATCGWYWWLGGRRAEGLELLLSATGTPGEVTDEVRAIVYALVSSFVTSGRADEQQASEWIHEAHRLGQRSRSRNPVLAPIVALERMLQAPSTFLSAWEPLLDHDDPWVRALARVHLGKMRVMHGYAGREADSCLETAVTEFRALGERYGISFALTELAERIATRGEFGDACDYYEQAIAAVTELGAIEDVIRMRSRQALLSRLQGDQLSSAAAIAEADRCADGVTWPFALAELALARTELARRDGHTDEARDQLAIATTLLGADAEQAPVRAEIHDMLGYLTDDPEESRTHRMMAWQAASAKGNAPLTARLLVGVADLAVRLGQDEQAARLLAASVGVRGMPDHSDPDAARIERDLRCRLDGARLAEATRQGTQTSCTQLVEDTLGA